MVRRMVDSSSRDLHPKTGCRYVLERSGTEPLVYAVHAFLPEQRTVRGSLAWPEGRAHFAVEESASTPPPELDEVTGGVLKLARVVRQSRQERLTRWRG